MMIINKDEFKRECKEFLSKFSLYSLRSYARDIGVVNPTKDKKKNVLIEEILLVLSGEIMPQAPSSLGAPVKNNLVDPKIQEGIEYIRRRHSGDESSLEFVTKMRELKENPYMFTVNDPSAADWGENGEPEVFTGQLETVDGVSILLPLDAIDTPTKIVVPVEMIRAYDLRKGDVISGYAIKKSNVFLLTRILTVNEIKLESLRRSKFDTATACYPREKINFLTKNATGLFTEKLLQWLLPIGKGQRGVITASPKSGKSTLLAEIAAVVTKANKNLHVMTLLTDQAPEAITHYRKIVGTDNLVYTTYEDTPERQVFVANFILNRAKRYAESGKDVLLLVDSFNALSRAYNDTDESVGGKVLTAGLESKTVQYLKRYLGAARCLEKSGSLTVLGTMSMDTGNPADDLLKAELSAISNLEIVLSEDLAKRRIYPPIDLLKTRGKSTSLMVAQEEAKFSDLIVGTYLPTFGYEALKNLLEESVSLADAENNASAKK